MKLDTQYTLYTLHTSLDSKLSPLQVLIPAVSKSRGVQWPLHDGWTAKLTKDNLVSNIG